MHGKTPPPSMLGHPTFCYRRPPGPIRRAVSGVLKGIAFTAVAAACVVPWWTGVVALWGAF